MSLLLNYRYSFAAGACAAAGSFFGKLPSYLEAQRLLHRLTLPTGFAYYLEFTLLSALPLVLMVVCNVLNWRYFLKALHTSNGQTLTATVLTAASNYTLSFILAVVIYQEAFSLLSAFATVLIIAGLWFLCGAQAAHSNQEEKLS